MTRMVVTLDVSDDGNDHDASNSDDGSGQLGSEMHHITENSQTLTHCPLTPVR